MSTVIFLYFLFINAIYLKMIWKIFVKLGNMYFHAHVYCLHTLEKSYNTHRRPTVTRVIIHIDVLQLQEETLHQVQELQVINSSLCPIYKSMYASWLCYRLTLATYCWQIIFDYIFLIACVASKSLEMWNLFPKWCRSNDDAHANTLYTIKQQTFTNKQFCS